MAVERNEVTGWFESQLSDVRSSKVLAFTVAVVGAAAGWYGLASIFPHNLMPFPLETISLTWELIASGEVWVHLWATLSRTFVGFVGAIVLGIIVGIVMGANNFGENFATPYILVGLTIPGIAWAAVFVIVFGLGFAAPTLATVVTVFPFIALYIWKGVENIDGSLIDMSQSFEISTPRLIRRVVIPNIAPALFTAARHGIALSWKVETTAELFASRHGIGAILIANYRTFKYAEVWAWAFLFVIILVIVELTILRPLERKTFDYREGPDFRFIG